MTPDAIENKSYNTEDAAWGVSDKYRGTKGEIQLTDELNAVFILLDKLGQDMGSMTKKFAKIVEFVDSPECSQGTLSTFKVHTFISFMNGTRKAKRPIHPRTLTVLIAFVRKYQQL